jgi:hypothetical protein
MTKRQRQVVEVFTAGLRDQLSQLTKGDTDAYAAALRYAAGLLEREAYVTEENSDEAE